MFWKLLQNFTRLFTPYRTTFQNKSLSSGQWFDNRKKKIFHTQIFGLSPDTEQRNINRVELQSHHEELVMRRRHDLCCSVCEIFEGLQLTGVCGSETTRVTLLSRGSAFSWPQKSGESPSE